MNNLKIEAGNFLKKGLPQYGCRHATKGTVGGFSVGYDVYGSL